MGNKVAEWGAEKDRVWRIFLPVFCALEAFLHIAVRIGKCQWKKFCRAFNFAGNFCSLKFYKME